MNSINRKTRARWAPKIRPLFTVYLPLLPYVLFALFPLYLIAASFVQKIPASWRSRHMGIS